MKTPFHIIQKKIIPYLAVIFLLTSCHAIGNNSTPLESSAVSELANPETVNLLPAPENKDPAPALSELQVHFIDVGQGDSTLIICENESMLIDAGNNEKGTFIQLYLQKQGIDHLTYVIGTHPDADHIGGLDVILTKFDCGTVIMPEVASDTASCRDVMAAMDYRNYKNTLPQVGDVYVLGDAEFTVIAPNGDYSDDNNCSVGIKLVHGNNSFLFTGDAGAEAEADILQNGIEIKADVLHAGHHGSSTSSSQDFVSGVSPSYAVISCGKDNPYGHPHEQTLKTLQENGVQIFRTDEQGSIVAVSDGQSISWNTEPSLNRNAGSAAGSESSVSEAVIPNDASEMHVPETTAPGIVVPETSVPEADAITYVLNRNTHKFHEPDCKSVNDIRESNREDTTLSRDEILAAGYVPCKICDP
ncbi:MAG: MBL fold metallo-hydrolase [Eubacterium sp.]|nr:MBL fold metallo-hydrolase [Eubacterium sp.]